MAEKLSFVPKTTYSPTSKVSYKSPGLGLFTKISVLFFVLSVISLVGSYVYKEYLNRQLEDLSVSLERAKAAFDVELIDEINNLSLEVDAVKEIFSEHRLSSRIFSEIEKIALGDVRFTRFDYFYGPDKDTKNNVITASLTAEAKSYETLAQQVKSFEDSNKIESFSFSNFLLTQSGNVAFDLVMVFKPSIFE